MTEQAAQMLSLIPESGQSIGNVTLRKRFHSDDVISYEGTRQELLDAGLIALGRGRGGSVRRVMLATTSAS